VATPPRFAVWLVLASVLFLAQGVWLAGRLVTWSDESAYVNLGYLAASGQVSLFQDEMTGARVPLPFFVIGASQLIWGPSLTAARLVSLGFGLLALWLTAVLARQVGGETAGVLAALFLATQGVAVGYFATGTYHAIAAAILLAGLALIFVLPAPSGPVLGMAVLSLLFLTRTNLWPILPAALIVLWLTARTWAERLLLFTAAAVVPVSFFVWDERHLKILAYAPVANRLARAFGYPDPRSLVDLPAQTLGDRVFALVRFARAYEFWMLAGAALVAVALALWWRGRTPGPFSDRRLLLLVGLLAYATLWQICFTWALPKALVGYFPSLAPLLPVVLGVGYARTLAALGDSPWARRLTLTVLGVTLIAPTVIVRHPLLPSGGEAAISQRAALASGADHIRRIVPAGTRVFLWGDSMLLYLAGRRPYLRQIYSEQTFVGEGDRFTIERSGLWSSQEMERWLTVDADVVVLEPLLIERHRRTRPSQMARLEALLGEYFERIERVDDYPWLPYEVYRRRPGQAREPRRLVPGSLRIVPRLGRCLAYKACHGPTACTPGREICAT
jgi:hypothetical protein